MGGEPTFVSIDNVDSPEWNDEALGAQKLERSGALLHKLREAFAPNGITSFAQGKWYPGEPTPRWALICHWRTDGQPIWQSTDRLTQPGEGGATPEQARHLMEHLCKQLHIDASLIKPLHEDPLYHLHLESLLPESQSLAALKLEDGDSRRRLVDKLSRGLDNAVGYMLPLEFNGNCWQSTAWPLRRSEVFLVPGDSPAGLRLPLDALPDDTSADAHARQTPQDPFASQAALPDYETLRTYLRETQTDEVNTTATQLIRTTLCAEVRDNTLFVFLPPVTSATSWAILMTAVECACEAADVRVVIEGYEPPPDARGTVLSNNTGSGRCGGQHSPFQ